MTESMSKWITWIGFGAAFLAFLPLPVLVLMHKFALVFWWDDHRVHRRVGRWMLFSLYTFCVLAFGTYLILRVFGPEHADDIQNNAHQERVE